MAIISDDNLPLVPVVVTAVAAAVVVAAVVIASFCGATFGVQYALYRLVAVEISIGFLLQLEYTQLEIILSACACRSARQ